MSTTEALARLDAAPTEPGGSPSLILGSLLAQEVAGDGLYAIVTARKTTSLRLDRLTDRQVLLRCKDLRDAVKMSSALPMNGSVPVLRISGVDQRRGRVAFSRTPDMITVLATARAIGSLLFDAAQMGIAYGALIAFEPGTDVRSIADELPNEVAARGGTLHAVAIRTS